MLTFFRSVRIVALIAVSASLLPSSIALSDCAAVCVFIHSPIGLFPVWGRDGHSRTHLFVDMFFFLLSKYLGVEQLGYKIDVCLTS